MKLFSLIVTLLIVGTNNLTARENPFEPTNMYQEEVARMMEIEEDYPAEFQKNDDPSQYEQMSEPKEEVAKKEEVKKEAPKPEVKKEVKKVDTDKVVYVPKRDKTFTKQALISLLPGVEVEFEGRTLQIKSKYEVFQKFDLNNENKIILDFRANTSFYTIRKDLNSQFFNKLIIGNHKEESFFRVVLEVPASPKDYRVTYDKDLVTVVFEESGLK
ncbi:AMIN domain-containing protein [Candidatus Marinarcus aquaticus]|uniref:AMIN domain-containing protein n=1 Tax=Candidatus Marinarcus aquaticus TaxID=2044504 RepID=A0A4Q0XPU3_9BACT|nr:AMIN domain-containing protein [Candidatus Marinarcus aquaticus]RXJ55404.1 hypothetical protein CRV04_09875 [Candidatus Marinarcus aquaticus]